MASAHAVESADDKLRLNQLRLNRLSVHAPSV